MGAKERQAVFRSGMRVLVVLVAATAIGVGYGHYRRVPLMPDVQQIEQQRDEHEIWRQQTGISLEDFVQHYRAGKLVIDARARELFEEGHLDAPLIMNVPAEEADQYLERALPFVGTPIVLYCASDDCESAETLWNAMRSWAFPMDTVRVYHAGWAGIVAAKLPTTCGPDMFQDYAAPAVNGAQFSAVAADPPEPQATDPDEAESDTPGADEEGDNP
jgi:hypothetical protein